MSESLFVLFGVFIGGVISIIGVIIQNTHATNLKKIELAYQYKIPAMQSIILKLCRIQQYVNAVINDYSGSDFLPTTYSYDERKIDGVNIGYLVHITELEELLLENRIYLSNNIEKDIINFINEYSNICSIELQDMKEENIEIYKLCSDYIYNLIPLIKKDLKLPL